MQKPKVYLAAPFFNDEQLGLVKSLEYLIKEVGYELFSPRLGENALEMNSAIGRGEKPSQELRRQVFMDNWMNIDDADLMVAVIDDRDSGTVWEIGYAFARHVPIITFTNKGYGSNLMLAECIIAHIKSFDDLLEALKLGFPRLALGVKVSDYGKAVAEIQYKFKTEVDLMEGPKEHES